MQCIATAADVICEGPAALTGVLLTARLTIGQPTANTGHELDAIAAVVLGGTSLFGGKGGVLGTFIAGLILIAALIMNYLIDRQSKSAA